MTTLSFSEPDLAATFDREGYVILKEFFEAEVVAQAREAMNQLVDQQAEKLLREGKIDNLFAAEPFETRLMRLYAGCPDEAPKSFRPELHLAGLFGVFFHPRLLDIVETFLGGE